MSRRADLLAWWLGSALVKCSVHRPEAVTLEGIAARINYDVGGSYSEHDVRAALTAWGRYTVDENGRVNATYASTWAPAARDAFQRLMKGYR